MDVIYVHRLLKNPVQVPEYLLVSDELVGAGTGPSLLVTQELALDLEGIGPVRTHVIDVTDLEPGPPVADPSWVRRIGGTFAMVGRGLPYALRRRRPVLGATG